MGVVEVVVAGVTVEVGVAGGVEVGVVVAGGVVVIKTNTKADRMNAERSAEHFAIQNLQCIATVRAIRTQWQRQDLFGADVLGLRADGSMVALQATAGQDSAVTARRRKLEKYPWPDDALVAVVQLRRQEDPANRRKIKYFFRILELARSKGPFGRRDKESWSWTVWPKAIEIPRAWFKSAKTQQVGEES